MRKEQDYELIFKHPSILLEKKLLFHISQGDFETSKEILDEINTSPRDHLAADPLQSLKNSMIISIALFTRAVINSGINYENAFEETDGFIRKITKMDDIDELRNYEYYILEYFCARVKKHLLYSDSSFHISRAKIFISNNIREVITPCAVSQAIGLNQTYLAKLFKQEIGMTMSEYILAEKIKIAKGLIEFSDYSLLNIATLLNFTDQSHFTKKFKKVTGLTPKKYKENMYKTNLK